MVFEEIVGTAASGIICLLALVIYVLCFEKVTRQIGGSNRLCASILIMLFTIGMMATPVFVMGVVDHFLPHWSSEIELSASTPSMHTHYNGQYPCVKIDEDNKHYITFVPIDSTEAVLRTDGKNIATATFYHSGFLIGIEKAKIYLPDEASLLAWQKELERAKRLRADYINKNK